MERLEPLRDRLGGHRGVQCGRRRDARHGRHRVPWHRHPAQEWGRAHCLGPGASHFCFRCLGADRCGRRPVHCRLLRQRELDQQQGRSEHWCHWRVLNGRSQCPVRCAHRLGHLQDRLHRLALQPGDGRGWRLRNFLRQHRQHRHQRRPCEPEPHQGRRGHADLHWDQHLYRPHAGARRCSADWQWRHHRHLGHG